MSRVTIYDLLSQEKFDVSKEYARLCWYFYDDTSFKSPFGVYLTMYEYTENELFKKLPIKGTHINLSDLLSTLNINLNNRSATLDDILTLIELILCIKDADNPYNINCYSNILNCINSLLDKTAHKIIKTTKGRIVVPNDIKAEQAASILLKLSPETALEILKYNHYSNNKNIKNKKQILLNISKSLEPRLKSSKTTLSSNILFLLNNFDIRHNNKEGKNKKDFLIKMSNEELEEWYDKTYNSIIAFVINSKQETINKEITQFKKNHGK